jgi:hypothetical protein
MAAATATVTALFGDRPLAPQVAERLAAAEAAQADLQTRVSALALDEELGESGAGTRRKALEAELASAVATVTRLRNAHRQALQRDARAEIASTAKRLETQFAELQHAAGVRHAAMVQLCTAIEAASNAYRTYIAATTVMQDVFPDGTKRPAGSEIMFSYATDLVAGEMHRHSDPGQIGQRGSALPGARSPHFNLTFDPAGAVPAHVTVEGWNSFILESVKRQIDVITEFATEQVEAA